MTTTIGKRAVIKRGDVFWVDLDPTIGTETKKKRPAVVLSNDLFNKHLPRLIVAPITSNIDKVFEMDAIVTVENKRGRAMLDQIRSVDKSRLGRKIGSLTREELLEVERALRIALAL